MDMRDALLEGDAKAHQEKRQDILDRVAVAWFRVHGEKGEKAENPHYKENMIGDIKKSKKKDE